MILMLMESASLEEHHDNTFGHMPLGGKKTLVIHHISAPVMLVYQNLPCHLLVVTTSVNLDARARLILLLSMLLTLYEMGMIVEL